VPVRYLIPEVLSKLSEKYGIAKRPMSAVVNLSVRKNLIATLTFNQKTIWPQGAQIPAGCDPNRLLTEAMNPGLGIRKLHKEGITGKGVSIAIIDQFMYLDHPEFAGKIVAFHNLSSRDNNGSMHGPAVTSLLVGTNCGTAVSEYTGAVFMDVGLNTSPRNDCPPRPEAALSTVVSSQFLI
jgi:subtilisin family serine protease